MSELVAVSRSARLAAGTTSCAVPMRRMTEGFIDTAHGTAEVGTTPDTRVAYLNDVPAHASTEQQPRLTVNASRRTLVATALAVLAVLLARPAALGAQHSHAGHGQITIPAGANYTVADVEFMQGMIAHHAQAIYMSRMAEAHGANPRLLRLATKIDQSQVAEIRLMQEWLIDNGQVAPDTSSWRAMTMPGMLTEAQLKALDAATGIAFDRAFLTLMIQHHEGALKMVADLFAAPGAGQEIDVNVFANDVVTVQTAEIGVMRQMLSELPEK